MQEYPLNFGWNIHSRVYVCIQGRTDKITYIEEVINSRTSFHSMCIPTQP